MVMWLLVPALAVAGLGFWWCSLIQKVLQARSARKWDCPQAFLVLGGDSQREALAARMLGVLQIEQHGHLPVYVSSAHENMSEVMSACGVMPPQLINDNRALDTLTNFTSLVGDFKRRKIAHLWLVTSDYHMPRARALADILLASHGIAHTCLSLPSDAQADSTMITSETRLRILRDRLRACIWTVTGLHGANLLRFTKPSRYRNHRQRQFEASMIQSSMF